VTAIDKGNFYTRQDSIIQDYPKLGLSMKTNKSTVGETEEKLELAKTDKQRIHIVEQFLVSQLKEIKTDKLIIEAVSLFMNQREQSKSAGKTFQENGKNYSKKNRFYS